MEKWTVSWEAPTILWLTSPILTDPWIWKHSSVSHSRFERSRSPEKTVNVNLEMIDVKAVATTKASATIEETTTVEDNAETTDDRAGGTTKGSATIEETTIVGDKDETTDDKAVVISGISETTVAATVSPV